MSDIKAVEKNKKMLDFSDRWKRLSWKPMFYDVEKPTEAGLDLLGLKMKISQELGLWKPEDTREIINNIELISGRHYKYAEPLIYEGAEGTYLNTYVKSKYMTQAEALKKPQSNENIKLLEDVLQHVYVEKAGIKDYISFMNVVVWHPKRLPEKALIQRSATHGVGKTITGQHMVFPLLGEGNCTAIGGSALKGRFTPFLDSRYVVLGELGFVRDQSESIKAWITDHWVPSEVKYQDATTVENRSCFCITTNGYGNTLVMFDKRRRLFPMIREKQLPQNLVVKLRKALDEDDPQNTFFADYGFYMRERGREWDTIDYLRNREDTPSANEVDMDEMNKKGETRELSEKIKLFAQANDSISNGEILLLVDECKREYPHLKQFSKGAIQKALDELKIGASDCQKRVDGKRVRARKITHLKNSNDTKTEKPSASSRHQNGTKKPLDVTEIDRTHRPETEWESNFTPPKRSKCALDL